MLLKKRLQLIDRNPKLYRGKRAILLHPNGTPDEVLNSMSCVDFARHRLIEAHYSSDEDL